jgi:hypothetical protein
MKNEFYKLGCLFFCSTLLFTNCSKKEEPVYGITFERLIKIQQGNETKSFSYDNAGRLSKVTLVNSTTSNKYVETYYRDNTGRIDSIICIVTGQYPSVQSSKFYYAPNGQYRYSIQRFFSNGSGQPAETIDSSIYTYANNLITQKRDFRTLNSAGVSTYQIQRNFTYDANGNLLSIVNAGPGAFANTSYHYEYDTKINPLPFTRDLNYYGSFYYYDRTTVNNEIRYTEKYTSGGNSSITGGYNYEYKYLPNNKPYYKKSIRFDSTEIFDAYFYYN